MVVDDDKAMGEMCRELLKSKGYVSDVVTTGKDAIEKASVNEKYSVVLTDLIMPDLDGIEVLKGSNSRILMLM